MESGFLRIYFEGILQSVAVNGCRDLACYKECTAKYAKLYAEYAKFRSELFTVFVVSGINS
jgi:hypothetical protein